MDLNVVLIQYHVSHFASHSGTWVDMSYQCCCKLTWHLTGDSCTLVYVSRLTSWISETGQSRLARICFIPLTRHVWQVATWPISVMVGCRMIWMTFRRELQVVSCIELTFSFFLFRSLQFRSMRTWVICKVHKKLQRSKNKQQETGKSSRSCSCGR